MKLKFILALIVAALMIGCGGPTEKSVSEDYAREFPDRTVISALAGEGDSGNVEFHIKYKYIDSDKTGSESWIYQKDEAGKWSVTTKLTVKRKSNKNSEPDGAR